MACDASKRAQITQVGCKEIRKRHFELMAADVSKNLERAKKFLEKNRVEDAIEAYLAVLDEARGHQEATQALGDLYLRMDQPDRAVVYYGMFFDLLVDPKDEPKALAIYNRFLKNSSTQQPPERIARYAFLQQKQNRADEAMDQYHKAAELFTAAGRLEDALFCWERIAQLDPENLSRQLKLAEAAEQAGKNLIAARAYLRAGQLATAGGSHDNALKLLGRAYSLAPQERSVALLYAEAKLRAQAPGEAAVLLEPFAATENDAAFLETFSDALVKSGKLDRAREVLEKLLREKNAGSLRLFELADAYATAGQDAKSIEVLHTLKRRMYADKRQNEFTAEVDNVAAKHPKSLTILEFWAGLYNELNREAQYFEILLKLFDLNLETGNTQKACDTLERLVDIDAYDYRNQQRFELLRGKADEAFLQRISGRMAKSTNVAAAPQTRQQEESLRPAPQAPGGEVKQTQALEDLIVQTEIFLQYSLHSKAQERLQKIAQLFPGEEVKNARLRSLYETANWWPQGSTKPKPMPPAAAVVEAEVIPGTGPKTGVYSADTIRDLSKISEISQKIFRQQTPRAMLNTTVTEVGAHLKATRAIAVIGAPGRPPEIAAEYCAQDVKPAPGAQLVFLLAQMEKAEPDEMGGLILEAKGATALKELGLTTAMGVLIADKETQQPAATLICGFAEEHRWRPNEVYLLQAIGDQMLMSVSHTRLRSLVRRIGVSDERSGLLSRSSYLSCLLTEADRAKSQGTPLSLTILQIDRGAELLRQQGESPMERFLEQLSRSLQPIVRQNDVAVKYTAWSLAFILPDTTLAGAQNLADKLKRAATGLRPPWDSTAITLSAGIVEAVPRPDFDSEDIVTDLINRAEHSTEEARKKGDTVVALESPKV
jgi:diguanylate cyclase (GGDEF)-like protein